VEATYNVFYTACSTVIASDCEATGEDLIPLKTFSRLRVLDLSGTRITDSGMASFEGLGEFEWLSLWQTDVGDKGIAHLRGLRNLQHLDLRRTKTTNSGLVHLKTLPRLECVALGETAIDDAGLLCLTECKQLHKVGLWSHYGARQFTQDGIARFQRAIPGCKVSQ
jgi:hypothetical protein